jgi:ribonuclease HI
LIRIYTDGSSRGNPGPGGYGIVMMAGNHRKEMSRGFRMTTNNRMELLAVLDALKSLKRHDLPVDVFTDSKYVCDAIEKGWVFNWQKKGFKDKKNPDLWREFLRIHNNYKLRLHWVKGHNGHPENERCDFLATEAAQGKNLEIDEGYENVPEGLL